MKLFYYYVMILMTKKLLRYFMNLEEFTIEKVIKKNGNKLCVKCKKYDNSLNSWIDKKT